MSKEYFQLTKISDHIYNVIKQRVMQWEHFYCIKRIMERKHCDEVDEASITIVAQSEARFTSALATICYGTIANGICNSVCICPYVWGADCLPRFQGEVWHLGKPVGRYEVCPEIFEFRSIPYADEKHIGAEYLRFVGIFSDSDSACAFFEHSKGWIL